MKHNILFVCGHYSFPTAANSICVQNLAEEFVREGHNVYVMATAPEYIGNVETINGVTVWKYFGDPYTKIIKKIKRQDNSFGRLLLKLLQVLRYIIIFWFFPIASPLDINKIYKRSREIIKQKNIDIVIATYMPYDAIKVALLLKKEFDNRIRVVSYHLDMLTNPNNDSNLIVKLKVQKAQKAFKKELSIVDCMLLPNTAFSIDNKKVQYVDFPLYIPEKCNTERMNIEDNAHFDSKNINVAIVGSLDESNRNPYYFCKLLDSLPAINGKDVILHVWGKLSGVNLEDFRNVCYHGMAQVNEVPSILKSSDLLLNVGNRITYRMIPSKIFQMFAAKKPIIFCLTSEKDKSLPYFQKYRHVCLIEEYKGDKITDKSKLQSFIEEYLEKKIDIDDALFEKSTPEYICNKILGN